MERLTDAQWALVEPHLPKRKPSKKGGRPPADNRACFEGVLWILRTGARWKDLPKEYPSPATCWRRLAQWEREEVWLNLWRAFIAQLDRKGQLDWSEAFMDGTFAPAKKGGLASDRHAKARGQSAWYWSTARVFLSECTFQLRPPRNTRSRSPRSKNE
jgi:transposase